MTFGYDSTLIGGEVRSKDKYRGADRLTVKGMAYPYTPGVS
jgi:hypothetical protein